MAKPPAIKIPIQLEKDKAQKDLEGFTNDLVKKFQLTQLGIKAAGLAWDALTASMRKAIDVAGEAVKLAGIQEKAERQLIRAQRMRGKFTDEDFEALQKFNSEVQKQTGIGDESLIQLQKQLTLQGAEKDQLKALTIASIGLTTVKEQSLAEAGTVVTKVLNGEVGALKEQNITAKNAHDGLSKLAAMYKVATSEMNTLGGQVDQLGGNYGDLLEELGKTLTQSPEVIQLLKDLNDVILNIATTIKDNRPAIVEFWDDMIKGARDLGNILSSSWFQASVTNLASVIGLVLPGALQVGTIVSAAGSGVGAIKAGMDKIKQGPSVGVPPMLARIPKGKRSKADIDREKREDAELEKALLDSARRAAKAQQDAIVADAETRIALRKHFDQIELDQELAGNEARFQAQLAARDKRLQFQEQEKEMTRGFYNQLATIALTGLGNMIGATVQAALEGEKSIGETLQAMFGQMLSQVGSMLISLGTATVIAASASVAVPMLWGVTGGVAGIGAGLGLITAGGGLMGLGGYITSSASETKRTITGTARQARTMAPSASAADSGRAGGSAQNRTHIYQINFNGALPGSERRTARAIREMLEKYGADFAPSYG